LDIDLLCCDDTVVDSPNLQIPHPRMAARRFVLQPLHDLEPALRWPNCPQNVSELLRQSTVATQKITQLEQGDWWTGIDA
jgi:7,8-dihydro-6-hydroxymethylpterin-pyrophosphokinase